MGANAPPPRLGGGGQARGPRLVHVVAASLAVALAAAVYWVRESFFKDGAPFPEAVPVSTHPDLTLLNRVADYGFGLTIAHLLKAQARCPASGPDTECAASVQRTMAQGFELGWAGGLGQTGTHTESVVWVPRDGGRGDPLEIVLLQPRAIEGIRQPPLILWLHGGGFTVGSARDPFVPSLLSSDMSFAKSSGSPPLFQRAVWASVQYRMAPQHPHPAALDDAHLALEYLLREYNPTGSGVGPRGAGWGGVHLAGQSAGGVLAAGAALRALQSGLQVDSMMLDVPCFPTKALAGDTSVFDSPSYRKNWHVSLPGRAWADWFWAAWTGCPKNCTEGSCPKACLDSSSFVGGSLSPEQWQTAASRGKDRGGNGLLPALVVNTARGDMFYDGGVRFFDVYSRAVEGAGERAETYRVDSPATHGSSLVFDPVGTREIISKWGSLVRMERSTP